MFSNSGRSCKQIQNVRSSYWIEQIEEETYSCKTSKSETVPCKWTITVSVYVGCESHGNYLIFYALIAIVWRVYNPIWSSSRRARHYYYVISFATGLLWLYNVYIQIYMFQKFVQTHLFNCKFLALCQYIMFLSVAVPLNINRLISFIALVITLKLDSMLVTHTLLFTWIALLLSV